MAAAIGKSSGVIRELVMMFGVNKLDNSHRTPLMFAALGNNKNSSCSTLLRCSADVNLQDVNGLTALHVACYHGNKSAARILLSNGASIAIKDHIVCTLSKVLFFSYILAVYMSIGSYSITLQHGTP